MIGNIGLWFINTRLGQACLLAIALTIAITLTAHIIDARAYDRGVADCNAKHLKEQNDANLAQNAANLKRTGEGTKIGQKASAAAAEVSTDVAKNTNETKEVIRNVYIKVPGPPVAAVCNRPVDERVQQRFDAAVDRINSP